MNGSPSHSLSSRAIAVRCACAGAFLIQGLDYLPRCVPLFRSAPMWTVLIPLLICCAYTGAGLHLFRDGAHAIPIAFVLLALGAAFVLAIPQLLAPPRLPSEFLEAHLRSTYYRAAAALLPIAAQAIALFYVRSKTTGNASQIT